MQSHGAFSHLPAKTAAPQPGIPPSLLSLRTSLPELPEKKKKQIPPEGGARIPQNAGKTLDEPLETHTHSYEGVTCSVAQWGAVYFLLSVYI